MKIKSIISTVLLIATCALVGPTGCANKLEPGGAYAPTTINADGSVTIDQQPDLALFIADSSFDLAYTAIDTAFTLERNNRALLWGISPDIKHTLDNLRPQAVEIRHRWAIARQAYLANPVAANMNLLQTALADIQRLQQTAVAILPNTLTPK